ncbi:amiloride-sensitive sodium channel subunit alpha, partial [Biomphalaria glabrata]
DSHPDFLVKRSSESSDDPGEEPDMSDPLLLQWVREKQQALCEHCNYCWDQGQLKNSSLYEVDDYFKYLFNKQSL